jgi:hypothetical protein
MNSKQQKSLQRYFEKSKRTFFNAHFEQTKSILKFLILNNSWGFFFFFFPIFCYKILIFANFPKVLANLVEFTVKKSLNTFFQKFLNLFFLPKTDNFFPPKLTVSQE